MRYYNNINIRSSPNHTYVPPIMMAATRIYANTPRRGGFYTRPQSDKHACTGNKRPSVVVVCAETDNGLRGDFLRSPWGPTIISVQTTT